MATEINRVLTDAVADLSSQQKLIEQRGSIEIKGLSRTFGRRKVLDDVSITVKSGEMVALLGSSGAGKSTLLRHLAGLTASDQSSGSILVNGHVVQRAGRISRDIRSQRAQIGFIFQQFNLVDRMSLLMNVLVGNLASMPIYRRLPRLFSYEEKLAAMEALDFVGLADHATQRASTLSGGQQQRGAIARTIVQKSRVILADEPIASLDPESARLVMDGLRQMNQRDGVTVLVSVHQVEHAKRSCDRIIALQDGRIYCDCPANEIQEVELEQLYQRKSA